MIHNSNITGTILTFPSFCIKMVCLSFEDTISKFWIENLSSFQLIFDSRVPCVSLTYPREIFITPSYTLILFYFI